MTARIQDPSPPLPGRVWTLPNLLSALRLAGVPLFLWLVLGPKANGWALLVLVYAGASDYFDGAIARRFAQTSRLGALLDPAADRLYIVATVVGLTVRGTVPWWLAALVLARDLVLAATLPVLARHGYGPLQVHFVGKAATFALLYAFPLLLLSGWHGVVGDVARPLAWAFTGWGAALYWWAGVLYLIQVRQVTRRNRPGGTGQPGSTGHPGSRGHPGGQGHPSGQPTIVGQPDPPRAAPNGAPA